MKFAIYVNKMKIQKSDTGSLILLDEADNILYLFPSNIIIKVNPDNSFPASILISDSTNFNNSGTNSIHVSLLSISEINGAAFTGNINDLVNSVNNLANAIVLSNDNISVRVEDDYEAFVDFNNRKSVTLVQTTIVGFLVSKKYYQEIVANTAAFNTLWTARASKTYTELIDL